MAGTVSTTHHLSNILSFQLVLYAIFTAIAGLEVEVRCVANVSTCLTSNLPRGQYAHCDTCSHFVMCDYAASRLIECPPGLNYDASIGVCNYPNAAVCGNSNNDLPGITVSGLPLEVRCVANVSTCLTSNLPRGQYAHCETCSHFVMCDYAASRLIECPPGLNYDASIGVCNYPNAAVCGNSNNDLPAITVSGLPYNRECVSTVDECIRRNLARAQYPFCSDCSQFVKCNGEVSKLLQCPSGLQYDISLGICNYKNVAVCGTQTSDVIHQTFVFTSPCLNETADCLPSSEPLTRGQYPDCNNCFLFYKCDGNSSLAFNCGPLHYDVNFGVCQYPGLATCA